MGFREAVQGFGVFSWGLVRWVVGGEGGLALQPERFKRPRYVLNAQSDPVGAQTMMGGPTSMMPKPKSVRSFLPHVSDKGTANDADFSLS